MSSALHARPTFGGRLVRMVVFAVISLAVATTSVSRR